MMGLISFSRATSPLMLFHLLFCIINIIPVGRELLGILLSIPLGINTLLDSASAALASWQRSPCTYQAKTAVEIVYRLSPLSFCKMPFRTSSCSLRQAVCRRVTHKQSRLFVLGWRQHQEKNLVRRTGEVTAGRKLKEQATFSLWLADMF